MSRKREAVWLARKLLELNQKPYNPETCDEDSTKFEEVAIALAHVVLDLAGASSKPKG